MHSTSHGIPLERTRRWRCLAFAASAAMATFALILYFTRPSPTWSASRSQPIPADFLYLMYPATDSTPLFKAPEGRETGILSRAVMNMHAELEQEWIEVNAPAGQLHVRRSDLRFTPPMGDPAPWLAAYNAANTNSDLSSVSVAYSDTSHNGSTETHAALRVRVGDNHRSKFVYRIIGDAATPLEMVRTNGIEAGFTFLARLGTAAIASAFVLGILLVFGRKLVDVLGGRSADEPQAP